ncbi:MAG: alpha-N-arabinofuranosidase [Hyphomonas sp.]|nr:alpha-N-arabinofuranosidase [Hyphomonas sp.]
MYSTDGITRINASAAFGDMPWDRNILGHFIEHFHTQIYGGIFDPGSPLSDENGFRMDVIEALRELRLPIMRWPGGNYVSDHHWYDAVGPSRTASYNKAWRVEEPNTFGTDEFIKWCELVGCEPYICTNGGNGTAEEMSNWVEYCNGHLKTRYAEQRRMNGSPDPFGVTFWGIGNESYGDWQIGAKTAAEWGPYVAESAKMMRAVDENIVLSAAAVPDAEWTLSLLKAAGRYLNLVSIHGYWDPIHQVEAPSDYLTAMMQSEKPARMIEETRHVIGAAGLTGKVRIAFDEWNLRGWHHPDGNSQDKIDARALNDVPTTYTMADAIFSAGFLNACLRNADIVAMANVAPSVNTRGPLFVHPQGIVRRTTFHAMKLYAEHIRERILATVTSAPALAHHGNTVSSVDALVSVDAGGATVTIINRDPEREADCVIDINGRELKGEWQGELLTAASPNDFNSIERPESVVPRTVTLMDDGGRYRVPPHSILMLQVSVTGE